MAELRPRNPEFAARVRATFAAQSFMTTIGAQLELVEPGAADITLKSRPDLCQQHDFVHAGVTSAIADTAAGCAALSLYGETEEVLTTEFKINLLRPAAGKVMIARGRVLKPGRTLTVCRSDVYGLHDGSEVLVATALLSMIALAGKDA